MVIILNGGGFAHTENNYMDVAYKSGSVFLHKVQKVLLFYEVGVIPFQGLLNILEKNIHATLIKVPCLTKTMQKKKKVAYYIHYSR